MDDDERRKAAMQTKRLDFKRTAETRPYAQIQAVCDKREHPDCTALDYIIVRLDNPWLKKNWPPHRSGCRCTVRTLSDRQMERDGLTLTPDELLPD